MKFFSLVILLILSTAAFASGGAGNSNSPFKTLNSLIIFNIIDDAKYVSCRY